MKLFYRMTVKRIVPLLLFIAALPGLSWGRGVDVSDRPLDPTGLWLGHYNCAQGLTGLSLSIRSIDGVDPSVMAAVFDFYPLPENPTATGQFTMQGIWDADTQRLLLIPEAWVNQPPGWDMVGLDLRPTEDFALLTGLVSSPQCGHVFLQRD